jgi:hypothetical protein
MSRHLFVLSNLLVVLQVFLLLFCFLDLSVLPQIVLFAGRFHPVVLHLPITLIMLLIPFSIYLQRRTDTDDLSRLFDVVLHYIALISTLTALAGFLLAADGGYDQESLRFHKWLGVAVAFLTHALVYIKKAFAQKTLVWNIAMSATLIVMVAGSHFGGNLTHGEGFFTFKKDTKPTNAVVEFGEKTTVYQGAVQPVLEAKCITCHNDKKMKGGLNLSSFQVAAKGGKSGAAWVSGDPDKSLMIERMLLDMDNKEHMPPKGKAQLNAAEILLFKEWIRAGANPTKTYHSLAASDTLKAIVSSMMKAAPAEKATKTYSFSAASASAIEQLNSPFRRILPLASNSPALSVKFYLKEKYDLNMLKECKSIAEQVVEVNLSNMPADDKAIEVLSSFENIERINLNGTAISGKNLGVLKSNKHLEQVSLASTAVAYPMLDALGAIPSLKKVFLWNTALTEPEMAAIRKKFPKITWDLGYIPDKNELLKLTPPRLLDADKRIYAPGELIAFKPQMSGVQIRYTTDGSKPDSLTSQLYTKPFPVVGMMKLRAISVSPGWKTSDTADNTFFLKGFKPDSIRMINPPDKQYKGQGALTLTDLVKGTPGNLNVNWLGYRDNSFKIGAYFSKGEEIQQILLSTVESVDGYVMPAKKIIIKGGDSPTSMKLLKTIVPEQPKENRRRQLIPFVIPLERKPYKYFEIEAFPVNVLPKWHPGKGDKGWVFVDEVFFY